MHKGKKGKSSVLGSQPPIQTANAPHSCDVFPFAFEIGGNPASENCHTLPSVSTTAVHTYRGPAVLTLAVHIRIVPRNRPDPARVKFYSF